MAKPVQLWSASVECAPDAAENLSQAFEDASSVSILAPPRTNKAHIEAIFPAEPDAKALGMRLAILASLLAIKAPKLAIREVPKLDWIKKVSEDFPPLPIARWIIFGAQHKAALKDPRDWRGRGCAPPARSAYQGHRAVAPKHPLQINATSAFGTGEHPTTRGCLLMLDWVLKKHSAPQTMLDMGCGSGILAMAFSKAARGKSIGIELDPDSVHIAQANIRANGLQNFMRASLGNGYRANLARRNKPYDLIMANIFAGPLCRMAHDLRNNLKPGGTAILSGLLTRQANAVIAAHRMQGLTLQRHHKLGEWSILLLKKRA